MRQNHYGNIASKRIEQNLRIETEIETDGRWIAEVIDLPGVLSYGATRDEAVTRAKTLALRVIADRIEHGDRGRQTF